MGPGRPGLGARSHVKYGLRYTKGCRTLVVGDPPPAQPQYYVNHPALETWILAAWMLVFGTADWSFRLSDVVLAIPARHGTLSSCPAV